MRSELVSASRFVRVFVDSCAEMLLAAKLNTTTASMVKLWAYEAQGRLVDECLQLFGGYGYMDEYLISRMNANARVQRIC